MIASAALLEWLADRQAQYKAHASIEAAARDWKRRPLLVELERKLALIGEPSAAAVLEAARGFISREDDIAKLIGEMVAECRRDPFFRPPFFAMPTEIQIGLLLFHNPALWISFGLIGLDTLVARKSGARGSTSINFTGTTALFRFLKAGGATLSFWEAPPITDDFVAAQAGKCRLVDRRRIEDGEELLMDGRYQSFVIEHASSDILSLQAVTRTGAAPLAAEYDSKTLSFVGASSTDEASSRVQLLISALRTMGREDALPLMIEALDSPHFYIRWHIMRELLALDADAALPSLRRMAADDPHPDVRAAARQTIDLFFEGGEASADGEMTDQGGMTCRA